MNPLMDNIWHRKKERRKERKEKKHLKKVSCHRRSFRKTIATIPKERRGGKESGVRWGGGHKRLK